MSPTLLLFSIPINDFKINNCTEKHKDIIKNSKIIIAESQKFAHKFIINTIGKEHIENKSIFISEDNYQWESMLKAEFESNNPIVLISDSGYPCVADPGENLVNIAHQIGYIVTVNIGPSSIIMALSMSGINGEKFTFNGYLPIKEPQKSNQLSTHLNNCIKNNYTQIYIETPYRNQSFFEYLLHQLPDFIYLSVSQDITGENEWVKTKNIRNWKNNIPKLSKLPTIFIFGKL